MKIDPSLVGKPVRVEWLDATQDGGDGLAAKDVPQSVLCDTVGWCIEATSRGIKLGMDFNRDENCYRFLLGIPRSYIKTVKVLTDDVALHP